MAIRQTQQPGPIGLSNSDGFPTTRLVMGLFAVAITLVMSWRSRAPAPEETRAATQQPVSQPVRIASALEPLAPDPPPPEVVQRAPHPAQTITATPVAAEQPARATRPSAASAPKRHRVQRASVQWKPHARSGYLLARNRAAYVWSVKQTQPAGVTRPRSRSEVQREYIAARDQVAALTGEDSGSAYLARMAARQNAARARPLLQTTSEVKASRRTPARS